MRAVSRLARPAAVAALAAGVLAVFAGTANARIPACGDLEASIQNHLNQFGQAAGEGDWGRADRKLALVNYELTLYSNWGC